MLQTITCSLLQTRHAFFTRHGGVSPAPFDALNLSGTDDTPEHIAANRKIALHHLGFEVDDVAFLKQVHGNHVCIAARGVQTGDALVTRERGLALAISTADCYPVLFHDPVAGVAGAAHAGWRGTLARIVHETIAAMCALGASQKDIRVAIGPGICGKNYEVSEDVIQQFREAKFPETCFENRNLDLAHANAFVAQESGIAPAHIWISGRCSTEKDFFSYRRDQGLTGRMWSVVSV